MPARIWTLAEGPGEQIRYSAEASDLKGVKTVYCFDCGERLRGWLDHLSPDLEITHWTVECARCHALYTVFND